MRIEEISFFTVYSEKCERMSFHVIHSCTELAFGKPERDLRPALHNDFPMTSYVPGFEYISKNCVGGFHFIFLVCSHDNVNGLQTSETDVPLGQGSFLKLASYVDVPVQLRNARKSHALGRKKSFEPSYISVPVVDDLRASCAQFCF